MEARLKNFGRPVVEDGRKRLAGMKG